MLLLYMIFTRKETTNSHFLNKLKGILQMQKKLLIFLVFVMSFSFLTLWGCSDKEKELSTKIEEKLVAYETDIRDTIETLDSNEKIRDYLYNWAKTKGVNVKYDTHNNVIMSVKAKEGYKDTTPTVIQCSYDEKDMERCATPIATALYVAKNTEATGPLKIIFTSEIGRDFSGITSLDSSYFTNKTNVISLGSSTKKLISVNSGSMNTYTLSHKVDRVNAKNAENKIAYKISIDNLTGGIPDTKISSYPNPIKAMGDLLAYFKTNSVIFEVSSISGGSSAGIYPESATMTLVINENYQEKFEARMDKVIETFADKYGDDQEEYTYTYEKTKMPKKVFSEDDTNNFVSLLYTILDGVFYKDDNGDVISITSLSSINRNGNSYAIQVLANSLTDENMLEINNSLKTIAGLCDASFSKNISIGMWNGKDDSKFVEDVGAAYESYSNDKMELTDSLPTTAATIIKAKNKKTDIIYMGITDKNKFQCTGTIIKYLERLNIDQ